MLLIIGILIVLGTIYFLVKQYDNRMVLFGAGFLMALISLHPWPLWTPLPSG